MRDFVRCCALIVIISVSAFGQAYAGSITYTSPFSNRFGGPAVPQFDSSRGALLDVEATVTGFVDGVFETIPTLASATYNLYVGASLTSGEGGFPFVPLGASNSSTPYTGSLSDPLFVGGAFTVFRDLTSDLGPFYGNGQIGLSLDVIQFLTDKIPEDAYAYLLYASGGGTLTVTYTFTLPEPPGVVMAGTAAVIGWGFWRWRRKPVSSRHPRPSPACRP
jgi:hypothetical protein